MKKNRLQFICLNLLILCLMNISYAQEHGHKMQHHNQNHDHANGVHDEVNMPMLYGQNTTQEEFEELRALFQNHKDLTRSVELLPNGIKTITETENEELRGFLVMHAAGMITRVEEGRDPQIPIQSPTLMPLFHHGNEIESIVETTENGVMVIQTSNNPMMVKFLQKHALEVSDLAERGMEAVHEQMQNRLH